MLGDLRALPMTDTQTVIWSSSSGSIGASHTLLGKLGCTDFQGFLIDPDVDPATDPTFGATVLPGTPLARFNLVLKKIFFPIKGQDLVTGATVSSDSEVFKNRCFVRSRPNLASRQCFESPQNPSFKRGCSGEPDVSPTDSSTKLSRPMFEARIRPRRSR